MPTIAIVTDTSSDLLPEQVAEAASARALPSAWDETRGHH
jgi:hypothetical protein